jgi:16S rRNA processing protein RimM
VAERVTVGTVGRPHGLNGAFAVEGASEAAGRFAEGATLYVDGEPATVVESKAARGRPVIRLDRPVARGARLQVPREALAPSPPGSYYVADLVGAVVEEAGGPELGRVADVVPGVANDVLELDSGLALPMVEACVREVDLERGRIVVAPGFAGGDPA